MRKETAGNRSFNFIHSGRSSIKKQDEKIWRIPMEKKIMRQLGDWESENKS